MQAYISAPNLDSIITHIAEQGFCIVENFLDAATVSNLAAEAIELKAKAELKPAGIGRVHQALNPEIRGDSIYWLDAEQTTPAQQSYFRKMEQLRLHLNQALYLGVFGLECHLAVYPAGAFYKRHLDRFANADSSKPQRKISCIVYLNQNWKKEDGGELRLYLNTNDAHQANFFDISPNAGRAVIFLSDTFYHEVLPAKHERISLTGWFYTRAQGF
jgi:SM-20-related protein